MNGTSVNKLEFMLITHNQSKLVIFAWKLKKHFGFN